MTLTGNTVRLKASFYNFAGVLTDPTDVAIKIYSHIGQMLLITASPTQESTGVYYYDYTVPTDVNGSIVYEFSGTMEGSPTVGRAVLEKAWV